MIKRVLLAATAFAAFSAVPASAVTLISTTGSGAANTTTFAGYSTAYVFNFNNLAEFSAAGFAASPSVQTGSVKIVSGSLAGQYAAPTGSAGNTYLAVLGGGAFQASKNSEGFSLISFYLGSVDTYNSVDILSTSGALIRSFTGTELAKNAPNGATGYRVTFTQDVGDAAFGGLRISSTANSAELDNLVFAVPEPSTWALMLAGFGMVGMAMRSRRRRTSVVFG